MNSLFTRWSALGRTGPKEREFFLGTCNQSWEVTALIFPILMKQIITIDDVQGVSIVQV